MPGIVDLWPSWFTQRFGHVWPESYLALDTEYTGQDPLDDVVLEIGHVLVENRRIVDRGSYLLSWEHEGKPHFRDGLRRRIEEISRGLGGWSLTWERTCRDGLEPTLVARFYQELLDRWLDRGLPLVGHNFLRADYPVLRNLFRSRLEREFTVKGSLVWDTGAIAKAHFAVCDAPEDADLERWLPQAGEVMGHYCRRVAAIREKGLAWSVDECTERFGLAERPGFPRDRHRAEDDAVLVHLTMEALRDTMTRDNTGEHPLGSAAALERSFEQQQAATRAGVPAAPVDGRPLRFRRRQRRV